jgi:hypothetical protein
VNYRLEDQPDVDVERVVPGPCFDRLSPPRRASSGSWSAGCEARGKAQGRLVPPGRHRRGESRTGELREPSLMPRDGTLVDGLLVAGMEGLAAEERQAPVKETT